MESFKQFLETASINGLIHISSTRRCTRLFWITLLAMGFIVSGVLIWESFETWADNPVRTTTRTVPMKEIKFPKLTVCPPKDTFTDLNYDLMLAENVTLTNETKNELYEYVVAMIDEHVYMDPWDKIHEENRFLNWYTGVTLMNFDEHYIIDEKNEYTISTSATSGVFTTQYFGENYNPNLVDHRQAYRIEVLPPQSIRDNENVTLHFKLEKLSLPGFDDIGFDVTLAIDKDVKFFDTSFTPPGGVQYIDNFRFVNKKEIADLNLKLMPGFQFSWYYTGVDFDPENILDLLNLDNTTTTYILTTTYIREAF